MKEIEEIYQRLKSDFELRSGITVYEYGIWSVVLRAVAVAARTLDKLYEQALRQLWFDSKYITIVRRWADFLLIPYNHSTSRSELEERILRRNELAGNITDILTDYYTNVLGYSNVGVRIFDIDILGGRVISRGAMAFLSDASDITDDQFEALNRFILDNTPFGEPIKLFRPQYIELRLTNNGFIFGFGEQKSAVLNDYFITNLPQVITYDLINGTLINAGLSSIGDDEVHGVQLPYTLGNLDVVHFS